MLGCLLENTRSLASVLAIGLAALGLGRPLWQWIHRGAGPHPFNADDVASAPLVTLMWSVPLGMLAAAFVLLPLSILGWMTPLVVSALTVTASILGVSEVVQLVGLWRARRAREEGNVLLQSASPAGPPQGLLLVLGMAALIVLGSSFVAALAPPRDGLELGGPLWSARRYLQPHSLSAGAKSSPLNAISFAWALSLDGPVAASLLSWAGGIWLLLVTATIAQAVLGRRWSIVVPLVMLAVPAVGVAMTLPLAATAVAVWIALACQAAAARLAHDSVRSWLLAMGVAAGAALGADARAWPGVAVVIGAFLVRAIRSRNLTEGGRELQRVVAAALVVTCTAYVLSSASWRGAMADASMGSSVGEQNHTAQLGSLIDQLGPTAWMLLPTLLIARRLRGLGWILSISGCLLVVAAVTRQMQFLLAAAGPLAIAVVWAYEEIGRWPRLPRLAANALAVMSLLSTATLAFEDAIGKLPVAMGLETRQQYLLRELPGYRAALITNEAFGDDARVWSAEQAGLYLKGAVVMGMDPAVAVASADGLRDVAENRSPEHALVASLRRREITHLLVSSPSAPVDAVPHRPSRSSRRRAAWFLRGSAESSNVLESLTEVPQLSDAPSGGDGDMPSTEEDRDGIYCVSDYVASDAQGSPRRYRLLIVR